MSKIHLIGGNGYVGALLHNYLKAAGHEVELASYRLPDIVEESIEADIVIHLATVGGGSKHKLREGWDDSEKMYDVNINGMKALLLGLKSKKTKIIFLSSSSVYGKSDDIPIVDESADLLPVSEYGLQKVASESILRESEFDWLILRPCSIYGPSTGDKIGNSFYNVLVEHAIKKGSITMMGGNQKDDAVYLVDLISIIVRSCAGEWHSREIFNVSGEMMAVENIVDQLVNSVKNIGLSCDVKAVEHVQQPHLLLDNSKLLDAFSDWRHTPLEVSSHALVTNYLKTSVK